MISVDGLSRKTIGLSLLILMVGGLAWFLVVSDKDGDLFGSGLQDGNLPDIDFATLVADEDSFLACPADLCVNSTPDMAAPIWDYNIARVSRGLFTYTDNNPLIETRSRDLSKWQFDLSEYRIGETFPDLITVQFVSLGVNQTTVLIYSRSVVGSSDKANQQDRILRWLNHMSNNLR